MKGVQFVVDSKGRQTGVFIDLMVNRGLWEDMFDRAVATRRRGESRSSWSAVKKRLVRAGKLLQRHRRDAYR